MSIRVSRLRAGRCAVATLDYTIKCREFLTTPAKLLLPFFEHLLLWVQGATQQASVRDYIGECLNASAGNIESRTRAEMTNWCVLLATYQTTVGVLYESNVYLPLLAGSLLHSGRLPPLPVDDLPQTSRCVEGYPPRPELFFWIQLHCRWFLHPHLRHYIKSLFFRMLVMQL